MNEGERGLGLERNERSWVFVLAFLELIRRMNFGVLGWSSECVGFSVHSFSSGFDMWAYVGFTADGTRGEESRQHEYPE